MVAAMDQGPELVVTVKRWPTYVLAVLIPVQVVLSVGMLGGLVWLIARAGTPALYVAIVVIALGGAFGVAAEIWTALRQLRVLRHPPRLSNDGMRLWLHPTGEYVHVPWARVTGVRTSVVGVSRGLFVHVQDPEALGQGDPAKTRMLRRMLRRFRGAPFVYALASSPQRLQELDQAVRWFTGGRLALQQA